ncbi:hypothetical protein Tco_0215995 [Tanacetum coccineum]
MGCDGEIDDMLRIRLREAGSNEVNELDEEGFNVYFKGCLRSDEHFNTQEYWTIGYDKIQKNDLWLLSMFDDRHQNRYANMAWLIPRKCMVLTEDVVKSLSAPIYCRDLDTTTLRDLIDSDGKHILGDPQPGVPRFERMEYRQSYHRERYQGVFEHMDGVYSVPMHGAYNPPGYAQPQYDQYYQQYPPPPPQYQQQQQDDDE